MSSHHQPSSKHTGKLFESTLLWLTVFVFLCGVAMYVPAALSAGGTVSSKELPIYSVETDKKQVALSFDAALETEDTIKIMEILRNHHIKATFFITGRWADAFPEEVITIASEGHDLGNHSENHLNMSELSPSEIQQELITVHDKVKELTGVEMTLFRPPYGNYDNDVILTARECGYYCIQWDVDSHDTIEKPDSLILN